MSIRGTEQDVAIRILPLSTHGHIPLKRIGVQAHDEPVGEIPLSLERNATKGHI